ncbi:EamA family transporter [Ochrobactrum chromiisoli]|uniref:EamA family transporter n=1 Tax=Ochrobactrum chromiisoli TaxID=2993941 RepID=A0ABT3QSM0_9HYPH|nr:EamA family transporter [Ochrobactrum chromiisoli]MCX2698580.1 EamA family transporter [Ochrobactrum chromiisoli]
MLNVGDSVNARADVPALAAMLCALVCSALGASLSKTIFPLIGPDGVTALRVGISAVILLSVMRPWKQSVSINATSYSMFWVVGYGLSLGLMNLFIYHAFSRLPIGIATAIEVSGPLLLTLISSRTRRDFLWLFLALGGLSLLLPLRADNGLDPVGLLFAVAASTCWVGYIVLGKRASVIGPSRAVAVGMLIAAIATVPVGLFTVGVSSFLNWHIFAVGVGVATLSSTIPYLLEMLALSRLSIKTVGIMFSAAPAIAAIVGMIILSESLGVVQWLAIFLIMLASAGAAAFSARAAH